MIEFKYFLQNSFEQRSKQKNDFVAVTARVQWGYLSKGCILNRTVKISERRNSDDIIALYIFSLYGRKMYKYELMPQ